jgi:adenylate cyclase class IV
MVGANVESKVPYHDLATVARRAEELGATSAGVLEQEDTYLRVASGRLKLRQIVHRHPDGTTTRHAELIRYERPDQSGGRVSTYDRTPVTNPEQAKAHLAARHGLRGVVRKKRELWLIESTRIHLDHVEGLGLFVELETVSDGAPGRTDHAEHDRIAEALAVDLSRSVGGSYIDLIAPTSSGQPGSDRG